MLYVGKTNKQVGLNRHNEHVGFGEEAHQHWLLGENHWTQAHQHWMLGENHWTHPEKEDMKVYTAAHWAAGNTATAVIFAEDDEASSDHAAQFMDNYDDIEDVAPCYGFCS